jgi:hypothetical protein
VVTAHYRARLYLGIYKIQTQARASLLLMDYSIHARSALKKPQRISRVRSRKMPSGYGNGK